MTPNSRYFQVILFKTIFSEKITFPLAVSEQSFTLRARDFVFDFSRFSNAVGKEKMVIRAEEKKNLLCGPPAISPISRISNNSGVTQVDNLINIS
jgi:hypothetical protein